MGLGCPGFLMEWDAPLSCLVLTLGTGDDARRPDRNARMMVGRSCLDTWDGTPSRCLNRQNYSQLPGHSRVSSARAVPRRVTGKGRGRGNSKPLAKETKVEHARAKELELSIPEVFKSFSTRFVRLNGILFTRTSLETFGEVFALVISDLLELLSSGPEEQLNFGQDAAENGLFILRLMAIVIFSVHNAKRDPEGQSYAEILQRTVLLQNAFTAAFDFAGHIIKRCTELRDAASSYLLPAILVFLEWLACHLDIAVADGIDIEEKQATARSFFWNQCVSLLNKLMLSGLVDGDEDKTCFFEMSRYDDGERGNRLALWEDFELRGFSPLAPAQLILDFSRKYSLENDVSNKEKSARVKRVLAAGRALMNVVRIGQQEIYYDSKQKKFIIAAKAAACEDVYGSDDFEITGPVGNTGMMQSNTANLQAKQSWGQLFVDGEEEDEVIVFKPMAAEKDTNMSASEATTFENIQPVQSSSKGDQTTNGGSLSAAFGNIQMPASLNGISQPPITVCSVSQPPAQHITQSTSKWYVDHESFGGMLKSLSIAKNELCSNPDLLNDLSSLQPTTFPPSLSATTNFNTSSSSMLSGHIRAREAVIPAEVDSIVSLGATSNGLNMKVLAALPAPRKNPVSRPARHFGPPPGFSKNPAKQLEDSNSKFVIKEQQPQMDDYSWLDGYKTSSTTGMGMENPINRATHMYPQVTASNINSITGAIGFPFPGKQIPAVQTKMTYEKKWQDFQLFEHLKLRAEQQLPQASLQSGLLPDQNQAQSFWSSRFFV